MPACFITGSGTDVGKTFLTCLLIRHLIAEGRKVHALKPVISGYDPDQPEDSDTHRIAEALGQPWNDETTARISPWRFRAAQSPHLAAAAEHTTVSTEALLAFCSAAIENTPEDTTLLIEGVGGALVPMNNSMLVADWIATLKIPALFVAGSYLGAISHSLSAIESLHARDISLTGIVVSESEGSTVLLEDTVASLKHYAAVSCPINALPRMPQNATMASHDFLRGLIP